MDRRSFMRGVGAALFALNTNLGIHGLGVAEMLPLPEVGVSVFAAHNEFLQSLPAMGDFFGGLAYTTFLPSGPFRPDPIPELEPGEYDTRWKRFYP